MQRRPWHVLIDGSLDIRADFRLLSLMVALVRWVWERFGHFVETADPILRTLRESPGLLDEQLAAAGKAVMSPDERLGRLRREREAEKLVTQCLVCGRICALALALSQEYVSDTDDAVFHFQTSSRTRPRRAS